MDATVRPLLLLGFALLGVACRESPRPGPPGDAGTLVTVYVPPQSADRLMGRLTAVASHHQWALSVRTDSAAIAEADLVIRDSAGALVGRVRQGSAVASQAGQLARAVLP
jgi:hypothetical protein